MNDATKKSALAIACLALFCAAQWNIAAHAAANAESFGDTTLARRIQMGAGKTVIVDLPRDEVEIVVGNPKVADAIARTARKLYVTGVDPGQTTIFAIDASGRQIANLEITIGQDVGELGPLLRAALPKSNISARTVNGSIILTGTVTSPGEAARAVDIAKGFASRAAASGAGAATGAASAGDQSGGVVNALVIKGEDQVTLKVTVAEVERQVIKQLGFSPESGGDTLLRGGWGKLIQENPYGVQTAVSASGLTLNGPNNTSVLLSAFERYGVSRLLAEPTVTAVSGEAAKMVVGGEIAVPGQGGCATTGATGAGGTATPFCTPGIVFKQYGVALNFVPIVLSEGRIALHLATAVTEVDRKNSFTYAGVTVPGFKTRKNETTVELPSGGSIATAGLLTEASDQAITVYPACSTCQFLARCFAPAIISAMKPSF